MRTIYVKCDVRVQRQDCNFVLQELWTLFDWVHQGSLLGTLRTFKMEFENPIIRVCVHEHACGYTYLG